MEIPWTFYLEMAITVALMAAPFIMGIRLLKGSDPKAIKSVVTICKILCLPVIIKLTFAVIILFASDSDVTGKASLFGFILGNCVPLALFVSAVIFLNRKQTQDEYALWCEKKAREAGGS